MLPLCAGGTGLGLCICQSLVQAMGGRIWLQSVLQKGTSFYFTVRLGVPDGKVCEYVTRTNLAGSACVRFRQTKSTVQSRIIGLG